MAWGGAYIALMLAIMGLTPKGLPWLDPIRKDIFASKSHYLLRSALDKKAPAITDEIEKLSALFENPSLMKQFQSTEEFQELSNDDSILELLEDDELVRQLEEKDYGKLMANPKFQSLLNNEDLLKKVFAFNRKIIEEDINTSLGDMKKESSPKYIKVE